MNYKSNYNKLASILKPLVPSGLRSTIRKSHQSYIFKKALKQFAKHQENIENREDILIDLIYGWGNLGWSAMHSYLKKVLVEVNKTDGPILECGSGLSSILMGIIAERRNLQLYSLEHQEVWANKVRTYQKEQGVTKAKVLTCPIVPYDNFDWYDVPMKDVPDNFSLIICDGPPAQTRGGRSGLLPVLAKKFAPKTLILFDDYSRKGEQEIVKEWKGKYDLTVSVHGEGDIYATIDFVQNEVPQNS
ncbi:MAG: hypothetical protein AB8H03_24060 [Saprospiraceae bacterium]